MAVDLGRLDAGAVLAVDLPDPGHAGDRIQTKVDELGVLVDIVDAHLQFRREQRFEEVRDVLRHDLCRRDLRNRGFRNCARGLRRERRLRVGQKVLHHALQRVALADETLVVHRQFARIGRFDRSEMRRAEILFQRTHVVAGTRSDRIGQRNRARQDFAARAAAMRHAFGAQFTAGVFDGGEQGFLRQIKAQPRREDQGGAGPRREAVLHVRADVAAFGAEQTEVGEHPQRPTAADGMPLHRGDDRQLAAHRQLINLRVGELGGALLDRQ